MCVSTQQAKRRRMIEDGVDQLLQCAAARRADLAALLTRRIDPLHVLANRTTRRGERKVRSALIAGGAPAVLPSEYAIRECIKDMVEHELALGDFQFINGVACPGVYFKDPLQLISSVCPNWDCATVLVDCGAGRTTVGIELHEPNPSGPKPWIHYFLPLLVYEGKDDNEHLALFATLSESPFTGTSSAYKTLWLLLESLHSDAHPVMLCGDHNSIAAVRGQLQSNALNPCPICMHHRDDPAGDIGEIRVAVQPLDAPGRAADRAELLHVHGYRIVPPALHVVLGLANALIDRLQELSSSASTIRASARGGSDAAGISEVFKLNGNQIKRFVKHDLKVIEDAYRADTRSTRSAGVEHQAANIRRMCGWLRSMVELLWCDKPNGLMIRSMSWLS